MSEFKCPQCGAILQYEPGTTHIQCPYCKHENPIEQKQTLVGEEDYEHFISEQNTQEATREVNLVQCAGCGAKMEMKPNLTSDLCPFCNTSIILKASEITRQIKPRYLLPFKIKNQAAQESFRNWINHLWFAPNALKKQAREDKGMNGLYLPFWTYDCNSSSQYTGERGEDYWVTEGSGNSKRQTRRTRWHSISGNLDKAFDDVLLSASTSLPAKYINNLQPWDMDQLVEYDENYLSGFRAESYQIDVESGFKMARQIIDTEIRQDIARQIGGDHQRIQTLDTQISAISFKHILLPVWLNAYRFKNKVYRFMVNARTAEVQGERPWSVIKISLLILVILIVLGVVFLSQ